MVSFATNTASSSSDDEEAIIRHDEHHHDDEERVADIIYSHFDSYQRSIGGSNVGNSACRAAAALRSELLSAAIRNTIHDDDHDDDDDDDDDNAINKDSASQEATMAVLQVINATFSTIASSSSTSNNSKKNYNESVSSSLELAASFACVTSTKDGDDDGRMIRAVIHRAAEFSMVEKDGIRMEACRLLGYCVAGLIMEGTPSPSILKKRGGSSTANSTNSRTNKATNQVPTTNTTATISGWRLECLLLAAEALTPRITDKIAKVRHAAITACKPLFSFQNSNSGPKKLEATMINIQSISMWILTNDSSAGNRALVARTLPIREEEENNAVACIVERIKDVDIKVREAALDNLRENVKLERLTEDQRVEILRMGLTKRCPSTYAKTVELLCCNWLKSCKFDPIALLDKLNPVLNENICEQTAQVLLRVTSAIDSETSTEKGVELVRKHFGAPEIRSLQQQVLVKRNIIPDVPRGADDNEDEEEKLEPPSLSPSTALFLRVKIDSATHNKSELISEIITDIPTLCNLLNSHIDTLIAFHESEAYDEMDEDDIAAYEDDKNFISLQLIHMAKSSEVLSEEGSRRHFLTIMRRILARLATPDDLVEACVKAMAAAHDKEAQFLQTVSEILVDVEDDDTFHSNSHDEKAIVIVRQMRIIAILSIVLESLSAQMVDHPIMDGFFQHLSPAITSKNAIVREHGVICLSKFCLLSSAEKVMEEFEPLLMTIAGSVEERVEVRAQAALALCDLALIHEKMLLASTEDAENGEDDDDAPTKVVPSMHFKAMLLEMLGHAKPGIVIIAAEIAAKLLLAGRLRDPALIAHLVLIYFDTTLVSSVADDLEEEDDIYGDGAEVVKQVGSPVRLQQLLSIFFPTYSMSSLEANDDMMASIGPLLSIVNQKLTGLMLQQAMGKAMLAEKWPIAKMVEYICFTVDLADKKKNDESCVKEEVKAEADDSDDMMESTQADHSEENQNDGSSNDMAVVEDDDVVEASSTLLASIEIAQFLSEEGDGDAAPTYYSRALAKILGSASIDVDAEDGRLLRQLKSSVGEAEYAHDDGPTVKAIKKLANMLVDVDDHSDDESVVSAEGIHSQASDVEDESMEKENPTRSHAIHVKSSLSRKQKHSIEGDIRRESSHRASLADVNSN